ncbi:MAG: hypothetical protein GF310_11605 [candidate division Zixibacteria bacterium]|nr:hypothetical protein [candidate division Zixibacteria bacterium]
MPGQDGAAFFPGTYAELPVYVDSLALKEMNGFRFQIAYNSQRLDFVDINPGKVIDGWENFQVFIGQNRPAGSDSINNLIQIIASKSAGTNEKNPAQYDSSFARKEYSPHGKEIFNLKFLISDTNTFTSYVPVYFYWISCDDNIITYGQPNYRAFVDKVYNIKRDRSKGIGYYEMMGEDCGISGINHICGAQKGCNLYLGDTNLYVSRLEFYHGGFLTWVTDPEPVWGDINMNNLSNEIADVHLYADYFVYGDTAFKMNREKQTEFSDVNRDGRTLTVADMVYMIRITTGDAVPYKPEAQEVQKAQFEIANDTLYSKSESELGAVSFVFNDEVELESLIDSADFKWDKVDGQTRAIIYFLSDKSIPTGENAILEIRGETRLIEAETADYYGYDVISLIQIQ